MFIELETLRNEKVMVNMDNVLFFTETKKGTIITFYDGMTETVVNHYSSIKTQLAYHVKLMT